MKHIFKCDLNIYWSLNIIYETYIQVTLEYILVTEYYISNYNQIKIKSIVDIRSIQCSDFLLK